MRLPTYHSHLTWIIFISKSLASDQSLYNTGYYFRFVLLVWVNIIWEIPMYASAFGALIPRNIHPFAHTTFRPYNSSNFVIVFQFSTAVLAG